MGAKTKIEWCDATWNPFIGCTKVSPGCANCFAAEWGKRFGQKWGKGQPRHRTSEAYWKQPLKWDAVAYWGRFRQCPECGWRGEVTSEEMDCPTKDCQCAGLDMFTCLPRVFCGSLCDWLDDEVPIEWLADLLDLIRRTPNLDWQLLTKRPQNFHARLSAILSLGRHLTLNEAFLRSFIENMLNGWGDVTYSAPEVGRENYWIGTSVEDQERADERIPELLKIPAKVRFLSVEPMLGPIDIAQAVGQVVFLRNENDAARRIDWIICGGESGPRARPMQYEWAQSLMTQCKAANVPFFMKQGSKANWPDFKNFDLFPEDLQVRGFPYGH